VVSLTTDKVKMIRVLLDAGFSAQQISWLAGSQVTSLVVTAIDRSPGNVSPEVIVRRLAKVTSTTRIDQLQEIMLQD
jgi:hypothetical protein